jgi:anaerobic selenocysteine-containing dehydrogenase
MELCGWGRLFASAFTFGAPLPGAYAPDLANAGCVLFWGYNPSVSRLVHATQTAAALRRGAKLVVVDPREVGLAAKAEHWLRVRPGTDAALALALTHVLIENGWYDENFVRTWTNADHVVDIATGELRSPAAETPSGHRRVFDLIAEQCAAMAPDVAAEITGVPAEQIVATARTLWASRPLAIYTWSGLEQHSNSTQTIRAICQLAALVGSIDVAGGNVAFPSVPANRIDGREFLAREQAAKAIGLATRPLSAARAGFITGEDLYTAVLEGTPYRARALVNFGSNLIMAHGDSARGRAALAALDFMVHVDLFASPTAEQADLVLPATSAWEGEALRIGFEVDEAAQSHVQLRAPLVPPRGEARSDIQIVFALASRLGLADRFFGGDVEAAWSYQLEPSGLTLEQLRSQPGGVRVPLRTRYRKYADDVDGRPRGFATPSGKVELYSEVLARHGYSPVPVYAEPSISPRSRPDLADRYPLVLTCAKALRFCETQHRNVVGLRRAAPDPVVEIHPDAASARGIEANDWVVIETPLGEVRARAKLNAKLDPGVVCGQHGWWQSAGEDYPGFPPVGPGSANLNLLLAQTPSDPVGGSSPLRAALCEIRRAND